MRQWLVSSVFLVLASAAWAQTTTPLVPATPAAAPGAPAPNAVPDSADANAAEAAAQAGVEIGFDPKVKRDPYGNVLKEIPKGSARTDTQRMRRDSTSSMRSDRARFNPREAAETVAPNQAFVPVQESPSGRIVARPVQGQ